MQTTPLDQLDQMKLLTLMPDTIPKPVAPLEPLLNQMKFARLSEATPKSIEPKEIADFNVKRNTKDN